MAGGIATKTPALCSTALAKATEAQALIQKISQNGVPVADTSIAAADTAIAAAITALTALT